MTSRTVYLVRRIDSDPSKSAGYFQDTRSTWLGPNHYLKWKPRIFLTKRSAANFLNAWCRGRWRMKEFGLEIIPMPDRIRSDYEIVSATLTLDLTQ